MGDETTKKVTVPCVLALVNFIYGTWQLVAKAAMSEGTSPFVFVFYRALGGTIVLFLALMLVPGLQDKSSKSSNPFEEIIPCLKNDAKKWLALGTFQTMNIVGAILAISQIPAITFAIFQPTIPILAVGLSIAWGMEKINPIKVASIIVSVVGAIIVLTWKEWGQTNNLGSNFAVDESEGSTNIAGAFFLLTNLAGGALYAVYQKASGAVDEYSPPFVAGMSFLVATGYIFVAAVIESSFYPANSYVWLLGGHTQSLLALCYAIVLTSAFNYGALAWAIKETTPSMVTSFFTMQPMFTALMSMIFLGVFVTLGQAIGGVAIIAGLLINVQSQNVDPYDSKDMESQKLTA